MGLFGGFKAKFTRNSTEKTKSNEVVCLRYHVISEFDKQDSPDRVPSTVRPDLKKNEVIRKSSGSKTRPSIIGSNGDIFENGFTPSETTTVLSKAKSMPNVNVSEQNSTVSTESTKSSKNNSKPAKPKTKAKAIEPVTKNAVTTSRNPLSQIKNNENNNISKSTDNLTFSTSVIVPITTNVASLTAVNTKFDKEVKEHHGQHIEEVTIQTNERSIVVNNSNNEKKQKHSKSILKTKTAYEETGEHVLDRYQDQSTLIFNKTNDNSGNNMSSFSTFKKSVVSERRSPEFDYATLSLSKTQTYSDNDTASIKTNEDDYKINIVKHDIKYFHSNDYSEDEMSHDGEYDNPQDLVTTSSDYSSHAASIFFGGDEVEVVRPRNIKLPEEDGGYKERRRSSSADC